MNIFITGGAGFIGSHLSERLITHGHTVLCIDNLSTGARENIQHLVEHDRFTFIDFDVTDDINKLTLPIDHIDYIYHLASPASPNHHSPISYHALPMQTMMANTVGTHNMLALAQTHKARFLFSSTSEVYGEPLEHPQKESYRGNVSTTGPRSVYDESKRFGETLTAYYHRDKQVDARIVRIFNTYGPRMSVQDMRMSVQFITQAIQGKPITVFGDGTQTRALCYVDDLVGGLMKFMEKDGLAGEILNMGATQEHTVQEYAQLIKKLTDSNSDIILSEKLPQDDPTQRKPNISKAQNILGWQPETTLEKGIQKTIEYFRSNT